LCSTDDTSSAIESNESIKQDIIIIIIIIKKAIKNHFCRLGGNLVDARTTDNNQSIVVRSSSVDHFSISTL
jgi:hypothetical protein